MLLGDKKILLCLEIILLITCKNMSIKKKIVNSY